MNCIIAAERDLIAGIDGIATDDVDAALSRLRSSVDRFLTRLQGADARARSILSEARDIAHAYADDLMHEDAIEVEDAPTIGQPTLRIVEALPRKRDEAPLDRERFELAE